jgi:hypothetical protein
MSGIQQLRIAASRRMAPVIGACAALSLLFAAPAFADESDYLENLLAKYPYLSSAQIVSEGHQACDFIRSGRPSADAMQRVQSDLHVSKSAAFDIVVAATWHLGC